MRQRDKRKRVWVTAYHMSKTYGGPEEGGWYWDRYTDLETRRVAPHRVRQTQAQLLTRHQKDLPRDPKGKIRAYDSVLGGEAVYVRPEETPGQYATRERPRYE